MATALLVYSNCCIVEGTLYTIITATVYLFRKGSKDTSTCPGIVASDELNQNFLTSLPGEQNKTVQPKCCFSIVTICMSCLFFRCRVHSVTNSECGAQHGLPVLVGSNIYVSLLLMEFQARQILGILEKERCTLGLMHVNREGGSTLTSWWCGGLFNLYDVS